MKKLALLLAALLFAAPAQAQQTKANMTTEINTNFPDNTTGLITPAIQRTTTIDMTNSWQQAPQVRNVTAASDTIVLADYGHMIIYNNAGGVAVSIAQATTSFATFNVYLKNLGVGNVVITPTISTINGAASIVVGTNEGLWIVSDGTNYVIANLPVSINSTFIGQNGGASGQVVMRGNTSGSSSMAVDSGGALSFTSASGNININPATGQAFVTWVGSTSGSSSIGTTSIGQIQLSSSDGSFSFGRGSAAGPTLFWNATTGTGSIGVTSAGNLFINSANATLAIDAIGGISGTLAMNGTTSGTVFMQASATGGGVTIAPGPVFIANTANGIANGQVNLRGITSGESILSVNNAGTAFNVSSSAGPGTIALLGNTSGFVNLAVSSTGGHLNYNNSGSSPTNNTCTGFSLAGNSTDIAGRVTFTSATSCVINFGTAWNAAPFCLAAGNSAVTTIDAISSTTTLTVQFGTAQTGMTWHCYGP